MRPGGGAVVAATHPEWIADWMLHSRILFPWSLSNVLFFLFPRLAQTYYISTLEPSVSSIAAYLTRVYASAPPLLLPLAFIAADLVVATGPVLWWGGLSLCVLLVSIATFCAAK